MYVESMYYEIRSAAKTVQHSERCPILIMHPGGFMRALLLFTYLLTLNFGVHI